MASITKQANGRRTIQFVGRDNRRRSIRIGKVSQKIAEGIKYKIEVLNACNISGQPIDNDTAHWLRGIDESLADKLANAGLIEPRHESLLAQYLEKYIASRTDVKELTEKKYRSTEKRLNKFFGEKTPLRDITAGDADDFRRDLLGEDLSENTIRKHIAVAKVFFNDAVRHRAIDRNPFEGISSTIQPNPSRYHFVSVEQANDVLAACEDSEWRLIFSLCRWGGLRCPSEVLLLRWNDIDWERKRITVRSPKTEHYAQRDRRVVPLYPEIHRELAASRRGELEGTGDGFVIKRYRDTNANLRSQFKRILERAGIAPWEKPFQNLRSTRQTELERQYPSHVVCAWMGNSQVVARNHYLQVTDEDFDSALQNPVQSASEMQRIRMHGAHETQQKQGFAKPKIAEAGLEPARP